MVPKTARPTRRVRPTTSSLAVPDGGDAVEGALDAGAVVRGEHAQLLDHVVDLFDPDRIAAQLHHFVREARLRRAAEVHYDLDQIFRRPAAQRTPDALRQDGEEEGKIVWDIRGGSHPSSLCPQRRSRKGQSATAGRGLVRCALRKHFPFRTGIFEEQGGAMRSVAAVALAVGLALVLIGCGEGDSEGQKPECTLFPDSCPTALHLQCYPGDPERELTVCLAEGPRQLGESCDADTEEIAGYCGRELLCVAYGSDGASKKCSPLCATDADCAAAGCGEGLPDREGDGPEVLLPPLTSAILDAAFRDG